MKCTEWLEKLCLPSLEKKRKEWIFATFREIIGADKTDVTKGDKVEKVLSVKGNGSYWQEWQDLFFLCDKETKRAMIRHDGGLLLQKHQEIQLSTYM